MDSTTDYLLCSYADYDFLENYCSSVLNRIFVELNEKVLSSFFEKFLDNFYAINSYKDLCDLKEYTSEYFRDINAVLRNTWNYAENGPVDSKLMDFYKELAEKIAGMSNRNECILPTNIKSFRGVSMRTFRKFGVSGLDDIDNLKGQYIYDDGFTSTSLVREKSFFNKNNHDECNIEIQYLIPCESLDVIPLINKDLSYSPSQCELLINRGSLCKIVDVSVVDSKVCLTAIHIPVRIWDKNLDAALKDENLRKNVI